LIACGYSQKEVAAQLSLAVSTVKSHVRNVYSKLGVHNRTQAIIHAKSLGILRD
ncbi:MAG: DNA-binding response regulator, partial [Rhodothermales bacterium]|nr:DNA-binding response regulator [Rhodothermales bacterium]